MKALIEQFSDNNFLVTTNSWFLAPDGVQYRAVWGRIEIYDSKSTLGINPNRNSVNWYAVIGEGEKRMIIAGCQILYACVSVKAPNTLRVKEDRWNEEIKNYVEYERSTHIYLAQ